MDISKLKGWWKVGAWVALALVILLYVFLVQVVLVLFGFEFTFFESFLVWLFIKVVIQGI